MNYMQKMGIKVEEEPKYKVYIYTNKLNGKKYVGATTQRTKDRAKSNGHGYKYTSRFYKAIQKYGFENFSKEIVPCGSLEEMRNTEERLIRELETQNPYKGYNAYNGGNNHKMPEETKVKISKALIGRTLPKEVAEKIGAANKGKHRTEEQRQRMKERSVGKTFSDLAREKQRIAKSKPLMCVETGVVYKSCVEASKKTGINQSNISSNANGRRKTAGGYKWVFVNKEMYYETSN